MNTHIVIYIKKPKSNTRNIEVDMDRTYEALQGKQIVQDCKSLIPGEL